MSELKTLSGVSVKDAEKGTVEAVFATFNVKDLDGDVTLPGAFEDGARVRISAFGHASWGPSRGASSVPQPPVGKGVIRTTGTDAILEGRFFLKTSGGREHFELVKEMGDQQEWSYGYDTVDSETGEFEGEKVRFLKRQIVHEVSPVLLGAGVGTRTLAVKGRVSFPDEAERVLGDVRDLTIRVQGWGSNSESKEGRTLSAANRERLATLVDELDKGLSSLRELLTETDPNKDRDLLMRELMRFERLRASL